MTTREQDIRVAILNTLLTTPHRDLKSIWPVHLELIGQDPRFYVKLAAWYVDNGDVRDHKEMFIVCLILSQFPGHRDVGLAMLRNLPPYQVIRVVDFISGRKKTRKMREEDVSTATVDLTKRERRRLAKAVLGTSRGKSAVAKPVTLDENATITESFGLFRSIPRSMKTEVTRYLRERESDDEWFDGSVLSARKAMKRLYALLHVSPGERAQQILFDDEPPPDSRVFALRQLAKAESPSDQAMAIIKHRIPYRIAATVIRQMTPSVLVALINQMSAQELINNLAGLKRRGALDIPEIVELVEAKLADAKTADRVSAMKTDKAIESANLSGNLRKALEDVADTQIKAKGRISRPTALLVDKSSSMHDAIELGKRIGSMISTICESDLYTYAFDTMAHEIVAQGDDLSDWESAFQGISASGATSCGVALMNLKRKRQYVEQIILVTDEGENTSPMFVDALEEYRKSMSADPSVVIVRTPNGSDYLEKQCHQSRIALDVFNFKGDYYSLPNLVPMLSRPSKLDLLMEIMDYDLPVRKTA